LIWYIISLVIFKKDFIKNAKTGVATCSIPKSIHPYTHSSANAKRQVMLSCHRIACRRINRWLKKWACCRHIILKETNTHSLHNLSSNRHIANSTMPAF